MIKLGHPRLVEDAFLARVHVAMFLLLDTGRCPWRALMGWDKSPNLAAASLEFSPAEARTNHIVDVPMVVSCELSAAER